MDQNKVIELENLIKNEYSNTAGVVVLKDRKVQYEKYFEGYNQQSRFHVYSVTKSVISILIGIAIEKGYIRSVSEKVLDFFPDYSVKKREKTIQNITIENMLTMTAPYKYRAAPYIKYFTSDDWVTFGLDLLGGRGKIGEFRYAPLIGPDILSGILMKTTGQSVLDFARENLFDPLEITVERNIIFQSKEEQLAFNKAQDISCWVSDPRGVNTAGWGLTLSPSDMAKIGQLYLDGGIWNGKQIVSSAWIEVSTKEHSRWKEENLPYGYLWWLIDDKEEGYAAMGDGGNVIYINPSKKIVIAMAAMFIPKAKDRMELIKRYIELVLENDSGE